MARRGSSTRKLTERRKNFLKVKTKSATGRTKSRAIEGKKTATRKKGMSNIPVGEGTVNNPNFGKKGDLSMFKTKKKVVKTETPKKKVVKTETPKKVKPKYKQVTQKELDAKIKERSKPKTKPDPLKDYRRGEGTKLGKDTRITKKLKKSGFTEDRLARLRKQHAEFKARRKKK